jgi:hypothetical protein
VYPIVVCGTQPSSVPSVQFEPMPSTSSTLGTSFCTLNEIQESRQEQSGVFPKSWKPRDAISSGGIGTTKRFFSNRAHGLFHLLALRWPPRGPCRTGGSARVTSPTLTIGPSQLPQACVLICMERRSYYFASPRRDRTSMAASAQAALIRLFGMLERLSFSMTDEHLSRFNLQPVPWAVPA